MVVELVRVDLLAIFVWDSCELLFQQAPDARPTCLLKTIYNAKKSLDKQSASESVNVRPMRMVCIVCLVCSKLLN